MNTVCTCSKCFTTLYLVLCFFSSRGISSTINSTQMLTDDGTSTLISPGGSFEFGFFSPENSRNRYIGIWYKDIPTTVVWVGNRDNPLKDGSGILKVEFGELVLMNGTNAIIWSTSASRNVQNPIAELLSSGNLVLRDENDDNPDNLLWQSFDHPTDTLLPEMKLGSNFVTGKEVYITSWKNSGDPATGDFTFRLDPTDHPQLVIKKGAHVVSKSGPWNGEGYGWNPRYRTSGKYTFDVILNRNEVYYYNKADKLTLARLTLSSSGVAQWWIWNNATQSWTTYVSWPVDNCDSYSACGAYASCDIENSPACVCLKKFKPKDPRGWDHGNWSEGCVRSAPSTLECQNGDSFLKYSGIKLPDTKDSWSSMTMALEECRETCLMNCSCTAYTSLDKSRGENGCLLWFGDLVDIRKMSPGQDFYIRVASSELDLVNNHKDRRMQKILILTLSTVAGIVLLSLGLHHFKKTEKLDHELPRKGWPGIRNRASHEDLELPLYHISTITKATNNFSIGNKLGEGGFGPVFKGLMEDGQEIAVKRLSSNSVQGVDELRNEFMCFAKLQHRNLVKLLGWCIQGEEMMLVYEYMPNKSLDLILFDQVKKASLDWPIRFNIINNIARGLMYLHQDSRLRVIHRDLKASNILLDSDMNPKISDFGIAKTFGGNETEANTNRVVGTYGYMSPEYATYGLFSVKSDVFSFGVLVLEIVTGMRNKGFSYRDHHVNLLAYAWMLYTEERPLELVDSSLKTSCSSSEIVRSICIALLCVQESPKDRPSMPRVVQMLDNDSVLPEAKRPGFFTGLDVLRTETPITLDTPNEMSITVFEAR